MPLYLVVIEDLVQIQGVLTTQPICACRSGSSPRPIPST
jgi:hypothetical protein